MTENEQFRRDQVVAIINSVIRKVEATDTVSREALYEELHGLHRLVEELRNEISTKPDEIRSEHIPSATDQLDAIIESTAEATGAIMDSCEAIEEITAGCEAPVKDKVLEKVTKIYEACSFQDITGQRITKVVRTLQVIDEKVENILGMAGSAGSTGAGRRESAASDREEKSGSPDLLNGPQMPENAVSQEDIDRLLDELG